MKFRIERFVGILIIGVSALFLVLIMQAPYLWDDVIRLLLRPLGTLLLLGYLGSLIFGSVCLSIDREEHKR